MQDIDLPAVIADRYRALRLLGQGGMGKVYEVEHLRTGQRLALKLLNFAAGASVERFKREARATSRVKSDHVVRVVDADVAPELGNTPFLVTELLEGSDLAHATPVDAPVPTDQALLWLRQLARGLDRAHGAGIIHRDLKPENVFLTKRDDGSPLIKILDFGISRVASDDATLTGSDHFLGTPGYMAPEQADSSAGTVTHRADLFALGLLAYRLLIGSNYFKPGSLAQYLAQLLVEPMPPPSERGSKLGPGFDAWFMRACSRAPEPRFESAGMQIEALALALESNVAARAADAVITARQVSSIPVVSMPTPTAASTDLRTDTANAPRSRTRLLAGAGLLVALGGGFAMRALGVRSDEPVSQVHSASAPSESFEAKPLVPPVPSASAAAVAPPVTSAAPSPTMSAAPSPASSERAKSARAARASDAQRSAPASASVSAPASAPRVADPLGDQY